MNSAQAEREPAIILLVTSDEAVREAVADSLCDRDAIAVRDDHDGAFEFLAKEKVDLVLLDVGLQDASPWPFIEQYRRECAASALTVLSEPNASNIEKIREEWAVDTLQRSLRGRQLRDAIERRLELRAMSQENRQLRDSLRLAEKCRSLTGCLETGKIYPVSLDLLLEGQSRSRGVAIFHRASIPHSFALAFRGFDDGEAQRLREVLLEEKPLERESEQQIEVVDHGPELASLEAADISVGRVLVVPLRGKQGEAGLIWIFEDGRRFGGDELECAKVVSSYAVAALENAERYHLAKERAFIDDVTEIYNARYLLSTTANEIRRAERYENPLSVLFLDLDRFKLVNDRHGHLVGSQTLRNLSNVLAQCVRDVDTLARYGGDEFTILLVDTDHNEAMSIAQRIRRTVEDHIFEADQDASLRLTVSVGVATCPRHGGDCNSLLDAADKAMYRSKSLGRNRVCSADELDN